MKDIFSKNYAWTGQKGKPSMDSASELPISFGEWGDDTSYMEQLVNNYHLVSSTPFIYEKFLLSTFPIPRVPFLSRKHSARSNLRMSQPGSTHDAQKPGEETHQLSFFFFLE